MSAVDQHQGDQLYNTHQGHGTFLGSYASHFIDDTTWDLSSKIFGEYKCDNWQSELGAVMGTASSMAVGLIYGGTEAKILKCAAAGNLGKCGTKIAKYANFFAKEVKQVSKAEGTTLKVVENVAPQIEKTVKNTSKGGNLVHTSGAPKKMPDGHMWDSGNPFRGKTAEELHQMFDVKGYKWNPEDPMKVMKGKENYINPKNGRQYHIDPESVGRYREPNHGTVRTHR